MGTSMALKLCSFLGSVLFLMPTTSIYEMASSNLKIIASLCPKRDISMFTKIIMVCISRKRYH